MTSTAHRVDALANTTPILVSIARAAELLSLSRSTIYELIWRGELSPIHIGRSVRLPTQQLEAFVDRHTSALDRNRSL